MAMVYYYIEGDTVDGGDDINGDDYDRGGRHGWDVILTCPKNLS